MKYTTSLLVLLFWLSANVLTGQTCTNNLLTNASFATNLTGWSGSGGTWQNGNLELCQIGALYNQTVQGEAGKTYQFHYTAKTPGTNQNVLFGLKFLSASWNVLGTEYSSFDSPGAFGSNSISKLAPAGTAWVEVSIGKTNDGCVQVSEVCLTNGGVMPPTSGCYDVDIPGEFYFTSYLPNGSLEFHGIQDGAKKRCVIGTDKSITYSDAQIYPTVVLTLSGNALIKKDGNGSTIWTKTVPVSILNQYAEVLQVLEVGDSYIFNGKQANANATGLLTVTNSSFSVTYQNTQLYYNVSNPFYVIPIDQNQILIQVLVGTGNTLGTAFDLRLLNLSSAQHKVLVSKTEAPVFKLLSQKYFLFSLSSSTYSPHSSGITNGIKNTGVSVFINDSTQTVWNQVNRLNTNTYEYISSDYRLGVITGADSYSSTFSPNNPPYAQSIQNPPLDIFRNAVKEISIPNPKVLDYKSIIEVNSKLAIVFNEPTKTSIRQADCLANAILDTLQPDLTLEFSYSVDTSKINLEVKIANRQGQIKGANEVKTKIFASTDQLLSTSDILLQEITTSTADLPFQSIKSYAFKIPIAGLTPESYTIIAKTDYVDAISESNEVNNIVVCNGCNFTVAQTPTGSTCTNNLLTNPSFATNLTGWNGAGGTWQNGNLELCQSGNQYIQTVAGEAGKTYQFQYTAKTAGTNQNVLFGLKFLSASWNVLGTEYSSYDSPGTFGSNSISKLAPAGTAWVEVSIGKTNSGCVQVSEVCLTNGGSKQCYDAKIPNAGIVEAYPGKIVMRNQSQRYELYENGTIDSITSTQPSTLVPQPVLGVTNQSVKDFGDNYFYRSTYKGGLSDESTVDFFRMTPNGESKISTKKITRIGSGPGGQTTSSFSNSFRYFGYDGLILTVSHSSQFQSPFMYAVQISRGNVSILDTTLNLPSASNTDAFLIVDNSLVQIMFDGQINSVVCDIIKSTTATCTNNLLTNPSFSTNLTGWNGAGGTWQNGNLELCQSGNQYIQTMAGEAGKTYQFQYTAKTAGTNQNVLFGLKFLSASWNVLGTEYSSFDSPGAFGSNSISKLAPAGTAWVEVSIAKTNSGCVQVSEVCLTKDGTIQPPNPCAPDVIAPVLSACPQNQTLTTTTGSATATWTAPTATDNCAGSVTVTSLNSTGQIFAVGATTVTYTARDAAQNTATCSFVITVTATGSGTCGTNLLKNSGFENGTSNWVGEGTLTTVSSTPFVGLASGQICGNGVADRVYQFIPNVTAGQSYRLAAQVRVLNNGSLGDMFIKFMNSSYQEIKAEYLEVIGTDWKAYEMTRTAPAGTVHAEIGIYLNSSSTCIQLDDVCFSVQSNSNSCAPDVTPPVLSTCPQSQTLTTTTGSATATWTAPTAIDNCAGSLTVTSPNSTGQIFAVGATTVTYTARDAAQNTATCSFVITVQSANQGSCTNNLLTNPSFANNLTGWNGTGGTWSNGSLELCQSGNQYIQTVAGEAGKTYQFQYTAKTAGTNQNVLFGLKFLSASWNVLGTEYSSFDSPGTFGSNSISKLAPAGTAWVEVSISKTNSGCVQVSEVCLTNGGVLPPTSGCYDVDIPGEFYFTSYLPNGSLEFHGIQDGAKKRCVIGTDKSITYSDAQIYPTVVLTLSGNALIKKDGNGSTIWTKTVPVSILNQYAEVLQVLEVGDSYIFNGKQANANATGLLTVTNSSFSVTYQNTQLYYNVSNPFYVIPIDQNQILIQVLVGTGNTLGTAFDLRLLNLSSAQHKVLVSKTEAPVFKLLSQKYFLFSLSSSTYSPHSSGITNGIKNTGVSVFINDSTQTVWNQVNRLNTNTYEYISSDYRLGVITGADSYSSTFSPNNPPYAQSIQNPPLDIFRNAVKEISIPNPKVLDYKSIIEVNSKLAIVFNEPTKTSIRQADCLANAILDTLQPDLTLEFSYSVDTSKINLEVKIANRQGQIKGANEVKTKIFASTDQLLSTSDILLQEITTSTADLPFQSIKSYAFKIPIAGLTPESYTIIAKTDYVDAISESNEVNNIVVCNGCNFTVAQTPTGSTCTNNLLTNPSFATNLTGWNGSGGTWQNGNLELCQSGNQYIQTVAGEAGKTYQLHYTAKTAGINQNVLFGLKFLSASWNVLGTEYSSFDSPGTFGSNSISKLAPAGTAWVEASIGKTNGGCVQVSEVCLTKSTTQSLQSSPQSYTAPDPLEDVTIYPNPAAQRAFIDLNVLQGAPTKIYVFDAFGKLQLTTSSLAPVIDLDLTDWQSGLYMVRLETEGQRARVLKLVVEQGW
jgi:hypothetical protein